MTNTIRRLVAWALGALVAGTITFGIVQPSEARGLLHPCSYDNACNTTTIRR